MAPVGDKSMAGPAAASYAQGQQFASIHATQHGGSLGLDAGAYPGEVSRSSLLQKGGAVFGGAPMAAITGSVLTGSIVDSTRTGPLNDALSQISGMRDQTGGRRKVKKGKSRKGKSRKGKSRKNRKQRGGFTGWGSALPAPAAASYMTGVNPAAGQLNNDWSAAKDPNYWAPKNA